MAESQKSGVSSPKSKEKSSGIADLDFGKDFLSSWKDDGMDFDFEVAPKGKKNRFDFGKMDMEFNLDGDFDKLSSFKIDMPDLDISSPQRKAGKQKEQSKEVSRTEGRQSKKDHFDFPFDFNKFDDLNFESSHTKGTEKSTKSKDIEEFSFQSDGSGGSGIHLAKDDAPIEDDISSKLPETQGVEACKNDNEVGRVKAFDKNKDGLSKSVTNDNCPPIPANSGEQVAIQRERTSPLQAISAIILEHEQENHKLENRTHPISHCHEFVQDLSGQSAADNASTQDTASNIQEDCPPTNLSSCPSGEENVSEKLITGPSSFSGRSIDEPLPSESMPSSLLKNGQGTKFTGIDDVTVNGNDNELLTYGSGFEHNSIPSGSKELLQVAMANGGNQDITSKLHLTPLKSGTTNGDLVSEIKRGSTVIRSNYFNRPNQAKSQLQKAAFSQTKLISIESKMICTTQVTDERRESDLKAMQRGINLSSMSMSQPAELRAEFVKTGNTEGVKDVNSTRECPDDSIESESKLKDTSRTHDQEATRAGLVISRGEKNFEDCTVPRSHVPPISSSEQANKSTSKSCINPRLPVANITSIKSSQTTILEKSRISPHKAVRRIPEHPSFKSPSRTSGEKLEPLNPLLLKNMKSMKHLEKRSELEENVGPKRAQSAVTKKQTPLTPTLKRKAFEDSNADNQKFTPLKRLSASPNESRNTRDSLDRAGNRQVFNHENVAVDNTRITSKLCQTSTVEIPLELNFPELETSLSIENDGVIKKAEACSKELKDICNMLKKKREEAKEILVRAIVNNNNLLILNHPMHQEKIRMVQKFAGLLISK